MMKKDDYIKQLEREIEILKHDRAFGGLTRPGLELEFERRKREAPDLYAVFIDLDGIHELNKRHGSYEYVDSLVRRALVLRHDDLMYFGRWKSGDEIVFIVRADPEGFIARLDASLAAHGLSATSAATRIMGGDLTKAVEAGARAVMDKKQARGDLRSS
jgi:hypothetical protein